MRPDEFYRQDAERWMEAIQLRNAIEIGRQDARAEAKAQQAIDAMAKD